MTKKEAVQLFVQRELQNVPQEWARIVAESENEYPRFGMWGTVFIIDKHWGEKLCGKARRVYGDHHELLDNIEQLPLHDQDDVREACEALEREEISWGECALLEDYIDEEMAGEVAITSNIFIHEVAGDYVISINAAGFDFYDEDYGVWPRLYDALGLHWHDDESDNKS